jgi:hypothetical protein
MSDFEEGPRAVAPWVLGALAAVCIVGGVAIVVTGKSAIQIEGLVSFLIAAVLIVTAVVLAVDGFKALAKPAGKVQPKIV